MALSRNTLFILTAAQASHAAEPWPLGDHSPDISPAGERTAGSDACSTRFRIRLPQNAKRFAGQGQEKSPRERGLGLVFYALVSVTT